MNHCVSEEELVFQKKNSGTLNLSIVYSTSLFIFMHYILSK